EKDGALERRFQTVIVDPPSVDETIEILKGLRKKYEDHHRIVVPDESLEAAAKLSERYITDRFLPDKAIDVIDEAGARARIGAQVPPPEVAELKAKLEGINREKEAAVRDQNFERAASLRDAERDLQGQIIARQEAWERERQTRRPVVGEEDVSFIVSRWTGIPVMRLQEAESNRLLRMEEEMHESVVGQNEAITAISRAIRRSRAGLKDPRRPIGSFIFCGPTGVFNILLQVLDEGRLTDNYGRVIDFKNTVVIMTSNVGARDITKNTSLGFHQVSTETQFAKIAEKVKEEVQRTFNPEFLNRLDDVIVFHPLTREHIALIVSVVLKELMVRLTEEELTLKLTDAATDFLVKHGYDEHYGARPLKRAIQRYIEDPLSEKILLGEFSRGDEIEVDAAPDGE